MQLTIYLLRFLKFSSKLRSTLIAIVKVGESCHMNIGVKPRISTLDEHKWTCVEYKLPSLTLTSLQSFTTTDQLCKTWSLSNHSQRSLFWLSPSLDYHQIPLQKSIAIFTIWVVHDARHAPRGRGVHIIVICELR